MRSRGLDGYGEGQLRRGTSKQGRLEEETGAELRRKALGNSSPILGPGCDAQIIPELKLFCLSRNNMANAIDLTL